MDWSAAMDQITARLLTMPKMRTFEEGDSPNIASEGAAAIVSYPENLDPHGTYNQGAPRMNLQAMLLCGLPTSRTSRQVAAAFVNDGPTGVVAVLESGVDAGAYPAFDEITVTNISFDVVEYQDIPYMAVLIDLDVAGQGV